MVSEQVRHKLVCTVTEANFGFRKKRNCTIRIAKTKALISFAVTANLICVFLFAYADCWFSHEVAHLSYDVTVFQWITSCNNSVMTTHILTLLPEYVPSLTSVTTMLNFIGTMSSLKEIKLYLRSHTIKGILHS